MRKSETKWNRASIYKKKSGASVTIQPERMKPSGIWIQWSIIELWASVTIGSVKLKPRGTLSLYIKKDYGSWKSEKRPNLDRIYRNVTCDQCKSTHSETEINGPWSQYTKTEPGTSVTYYVWKWNVAELGANIWKRNLWCLEEWNHAEAGANIPKRNLEPYSKTESVASVTIRCLNDWNQAKPESNKSKTEVKFLANIPKRDLCSHT